LQKPYVKIYFNNQCYGTTKCVKKTLNPRWNQKFKIRIPGKDAEKILQDSQNGGSTVNHQIMFWILDQDELSDDDNMGIAYASLLDPFHPTTSSRSTTNMGPTTWYPVQNGAEGTPMYSKNATGDIQIKMQTRIQKVLNVVKGNSQSISGGTIQVCLNWSKQQDGERIDIDTSCVGIDSNGTVLMDETVYYDDLINSNGSIRHSGDQVLGGGKDEVITCNLDRVPRHVRALYFVLTVVTPGRTLADVKSASVEVVNAGSGLIMCRFTPSLLGENTAMFLMRIERKPETFGLWKMKIIDESDKTGKWNR
jgi:tellurium resistance protein TerZ